MSVLALSTSPGESLSVLAAAVVALGVLGFLVGTALRLKRRA